MNKQREALKLALEVLEEINKLSIGENAICLPAEIDTAMDAIREALAEPEQKLDSALEALQNEMRETIAKLDPNEMVTVMPPSKPIGSVIGWYGGYPMIELFSGGWIPAVGTVLYSAPPTRRSLTDEEILNLWEDRRYHCEGEDFIKLVRWIERWYRQ